MADSRFNWGSGKLDNYRKKPVTEQRPWLTHEHDTLLKLRSISMSYTEISKRLGRSIGSLTSHMDAGMFKYYDTVNQHRDQIIERMLNEAGFTERTDTDSQSEGYFEA